MMTRPISLLFIVFLLSLPIMIPAAQAQNFEEQIRSIRSQNTRYQSSIEELRARMAELQSEITSTSTREEEMFREYQKLEREVAIQDRLLRQLQQQGRQITQEISVTQASYRQLEKDLERLIEAYQKSLSHIYKHGRMNELALILTSGSINQMMVRAYYLRKFDEQRTRQSEQIRDGQEKLKEKEADLATARERNRENALAQQQEKAKLDDKRKRQETVLTDLRQNRRFLERRLEESRKEARDLENALLAAEREINNLLRLQRDEEERLANLARARENPNAEERREEVARYSVPIYTGEILSEAELTNINESFRNARGRLPWPVDTGEIITPFGLVRNPVHNTETHNPGVQISVAPGSPVRAVHKGIVSVTVIPTYGETVMIRHGKDHITLYSNLSRVMVKTGTVVNPGDVIGLSGRSESIMGAVLFFMVRDLSGSSARDIDPALWLRQR